MTELSDLQIATIKGAVEWLAYQPARRSSEQETFAWDMARFLEKALDGCEDSARTLRVKLPTIRFHWWEYKKDDPEMGLWLSE